jgi:hypothetical protein
VTAPDPRERARRRGSRAGVVVGALAAAAALVAAGWNARGGGDVRPGTPIRTEIALPAKQALWFPGMLHAFALSPDGSRVVYAARQEGRRPMLHVRTLATRETIALEGTELATNPAFSPDGEWIAFLAAGIELRKVPARGGGAVVVAEAPAHLAGLVWAADGAIVFTPRPATGLWRVPRGGGEPVQLTFPDFDAGEGSHVWPATVPGTKLLLYVAEVEAADSFDAARIYAFDPDTGARTLVIDGGTDPRVVDGVLHYARAGTIYAVPFDAARVAIRGAPRPLHEGVE